MNLPLPFRPGWRDHRPARGFSLIELLIALAIGLLALMFAMRIVVDSERNKSTSAGGSDAMQNGVLALFAINRDISQAGFALNDPMLVGCNLVLTDSGGYQIPQVARGGVMIRPLAPALIESNGSAPDRVHLFSGSSISGTASLRLTSDYTVGDSLSIDRVPYGFARGDVIVVAPETIGSDCSLAQIANDPTALPPPPATQTISIAAGAGMRFNSGNLGATFKASQGRVFNLGPAPTLSFHSWSVQDNLLRLSATDLNNGDAAPTTVIDNVVSLKAQYGFDTRVGEDFKPEEGTLIARWSPTMIDADGDGIGGSPGDYQRVVALRIGLVVRSAAMEKPAANGSCSATPSAPQLFASAEPAGVAAVPVTVDLASTDTNWQCYRYRVFDTIVPLRNVGWRPTAK